MKEYKCKCGKGKWLKHKCNIYKDGKLELIYVCSYCGLSVCIDKGQEVKQMIKNLS